MDKSTTTKKAKTNNNTKNSNDSNNTSNNYNSSPVATDEYKFVSKDGLYYTTYNDYVAANVRYNQNILKEKGLLDKPTFRRSINNNNNNTATKRNLNFTSRRTGTTSNGDIVTTSTTDTTRQTRSQTSRRRSNRLQKSKETTLADSSSRIVTPSPTANSTNSTDVSISSFIVDDPPRKKIKKVLSISSSMTTIRTTNELTESERESMKGIPHEEWIPAMEYYLENVEKISYRNQRSVMNQMHKLCNGDGISYRHWPDNIWYYKNKSINLAIDCVDLYHDAIQYENSYGRDKGNGWLLRHPITKLSNFQAYYYEKVQSKKSNK